MKRIGKVIVCYVCGVPGGTLERIDEGKYRYVTNVPRMKR